MAPIFRRIARGAAALRSPSGDPLAAIRRAVQRRLGSGVVARVVGSELAVLWFAVAAWNRPVPAYAGARRYGYASGAGGLHLALLMVSVVEIVAVHLLVSRWSGLAAWVLTGLAAYGVLWIVADLRAMRLRPTTVDDATLVIRTGLRWTMEVPRERIVAASRRDWRRPFGDADHELNLATVGDPDVIVELDRPMEAAGPFGITRMARTVGFSSDEPDRLVLDINGR